MTRTKVSVAILLSGLVAPAALAEPVPALARTRSELEAMLAAVPGPIGRITLVGDPAKPGVYVQILRIAPHGRLEAHHHSADRVSTVLSGTWGIGYGAAFDRAALKTTPAGSIFTEPAEVDHFGEAGDQPVMVEVTGMGPVTTTPASPAR